VSCGQRRGKGRAPRVPARPGASGPRNQEESGGGGRGEYGVGHGRQELRTPAVNRLIPHPTVGRVPVVPKP
jgi:hypothetical protein